jgi:Ca-activated chloride channel homolog
MTSRLLPSLSLLLLALPAAQAQQKTADDFFHGGAMGYLSNNIPAALQEVTNGRAYYPDDVKLKKLEELLKQQQQQQQQQNQDQKQQQDQSKNDQQKQQQQKPQQQSQQNQKKEQGGEQQKQAAAQMTPAQAERMLDSQKGEESALVFKPAARPEDQNRKFKDW